MSDIEIGILSIGRNLHPCVVEVDGMTDQQIRAIQLLSAEGLVESFGPYGGYRITDDGIRALRAEEEMREQRSKQKEEEESRRMDEEQKEKTKNKRETLFFWLRALLDLFFLIAGAVLERNTGFVDWIISIF